MADITALLNLIKPDIEKIEKTMRADVDNIAANMDNLLLEILNYGLFGGGKRFRPLLAVIAARLCSVQKDSLYDLSIAFEYLHLATLFHDDVIDKADTRRGKPSVCKAYGIVPAILAGDFLHARSMEIIGRYGGRKALDIFCGAARAMVDGEFLQLRNARNYSQSEEDYFHTIKGKTGLLIAATTEIGALYGGADASQQIALKEYGSNLGCAFQIVDDLLDYMGDAEKTGKVIGNDLSEGKMTLPLILAMDKADSKDKERFLEILADQELRQRSFSEVTELIEKYNGFEKTRKRAEYCASEAIRQLEIFPQEKKREIQIFIALSQYVLVREK
jgi:octaprenyl-diphosphate synthase